MATLEQKFQAYRRAASLASATYSTTSAAAYKGYVTAMKPVTEAHQAGHAAATQAFADARAAVDATYNTRRLAIEQTWTTARAEALRVYQAAYTAADALLK